jgi:hypothetical protein
MVISETPSSEPIDVTEHTPLEGLLKEGANSVDLFNAMVQLGVFSEKENLDIILHRRPLHFPDEASTWVDVRASPCVRPIRFEYCHSLLVWYGSIGGARSTPAGS